MMMYFHGGFTEVILFKDWSTSSIRDFSLSILAIFILAVLYEALKLFREYLLQREIISNCAQIRTNSRESLTMVFNNNYTDINVNAEESAPSIPPSPAPIDSCRRCPCPTAGGRSIAQMSQALLKPKLCRPMHIIQTIMHLLQISISYMLMLIAMTYNWYLFAAVVLGSAFGHFLFAWQRTTLFDCSEHCH